MKVLRCLIFISILFLFPGNAVALTREKSEQLAKDLANNIHLTKLAQNVTDEEELIWKNAALGSLSIALLEIGDRDRSIEIFRSIEDRFLQQQTLSELVLRLIRKGDVKVALELIRTFSDGDPAFLSDIFRNLIAEDRGDRAWEIVQLINSDDRQILLLFLQAAIANEDYDRAWDIIRDRQRELLPYINLKGMALGFAKQGKSDRILEIMTVLESDRDRQDLTLLVALTLTEQGELKQALEVVKRLESPLGQVEALGAIGLKYMAMGEGDRGEKEFDRLKELLPQLEPNEATDAVFKNLASSLARGEEFDLALQLSDRLSNPSLKPETLFYIARYLGEAKQFDRALEITENIDIPELQETAIQEISINLAENGDSDRALKLIQSFSNRDKTLNNIATILAEKEQFDRALKITEEIQETEIKIVTLGAIALQLQQNKQLETASKIREQTLQLWDNLNDSSTKDSLLSLIVLPFLEIEAYDIALEMLQRSPNLEDKSNTLRDVTYTLAEAGKMTESLEFIALVGNEIEKIGTFIFLAIQLDRQDRQADAIISLTHALELVGTLEKKEQKALLLSSIATQLAEIGRSQQATEITDDVLKLLQLFAR
ncbi:hypothetical protein [Spirulina sp. 06S082]|uniref:tetratricopeptide repeat protein n=1 Tax=Spirulina sp. 06S082 TaxID=3110248 RepID=UPI002B22114F|nr:hypothetical protein [Spirulina sp. 06S082]MEA5469676.1 hypothetical protein [Spirulina sp. 06S082]